MPLPRWIKALSYFDRLPEIWRAIRWTNSWWKLLRAYLKLGSVDYPFILRSRSGIQLQMNNYHDSVTAWVIFCRHEYFVPTNAKLIIDLGANFGGFTIFAAERAKNSRIISLEPFPATFERLCENIAVNGLQQRATCLPLAIAKTSSERNMSFEDGVDQSRGLIPEGTVFTEQVVTVKTISLPELLNYVSKNFGDQQIDLVKMDIEGGEHEWLPELPAHTLHNIRLWEMEYHPSGSKQVLFQALERAGLYCIKDIIIGADCGVAYFERR